MCHVKLPRLTLISLISISLAVCDFDSFSVIMGIGYVLFVWLYIPYLSCDYLSCYDAYVCL